MLWKSLITTADEIHCFQCSEDLKINFLASHIFNFSANNILLSGWFHNLITHTQQIVSMFVTTYFYKQLFSKMKQIKSILHSQLPNHHLSNVHLLSTSSFKSDMISFCDCKQHQIYHGCYFINLVFGGARGVMVIIAGNGYGDTSSNLGQDGLHFT